jgi:LacI family transcriptional regulator
MRKLLLQDLSNQLGYSKTLISMVLNGKGNHYGISKKTQATVLDAIAKLNYAPNKFAKSLRTGKSNFIGLIVTDIANTFYSTIAKNIENVLFEKGYNLMVCSTEENEEKEKQLVEMMVNKQGVDGLIVASTFKNPTFYEQPRFSKIPIVFIDRVVPLYSANYVVIDNYGGSLEIVNHLLDEGCKNIACFAITPLYLSTIEDRINGFKKAMSARGHKNPDKLIKPISFKNLSDDVEKTLREFMDSKTEIDAIFALNNHIATALLNALHKKEFQKLENIKIACFDDIDLFNYVNKKVSSVKQPIEEIGKSSSSIILDLISGKKLTKSTVVLNTKMVVR